MTRHYSNSGPSHVTKDHWKNDDPNYKGSLYNVLVAWETREITEEPLSIIAANDPVTCAAYAKKHNMLNLPGSKRFRDVARH